MRERRLDGRDGLLPDERDAVAIEADDGALGVGQKDDDARAEIEQDLRADASYYWRNKVGATVGLFDTFGSTNPDIYSANRTSKPDSTGLMFQLDGTPWGDGTSPLGPRFNMRVGVQYTLYTRFNGASSNYDGAGANASDNNTLRTFLWIAY